MAVNITDPNPSVFVAKGVEGVNPLEGVKDILAAIPESDDKGAALNEFELQIQQLEADEANAAVFPSEVRMADALIEEENVDEPMVDFQAERRKIIGDFDKKMQSIQRHTAQTGRSGREKAFVLMQQFSNANPAFAVDIQEYFSKRFSSKGLGLFSPIADEALEEQKLSQEVASVYGRDTPDNRALYLETQKRTGDRLTQIARAQDNEDHLRSTVVASTKAELNSSFAAIYNRAIENGWTEQMQVQQFKDVMTARRQQLSTALDNMIANKQLFPENKTKILTEFDNQNVVYIDNLEKKGFSVQAEDYNKARKLWVQGILNIDDIRQLGDLHEFGIQGFVTFLEAFDSDPGKKKQILSMLGTEFSPDTLLALEARGLTPELTSRLKEAWTLALSGACPASYEGTKMCAYFQRQMLHQRRAPEVGEYQVSILPSDVALKDAADSVNVLRGVATAAEKMPANKNKWHLFAVSQTQTMANTNLLPSAETEFRYVPEEDKFVRVIKDNPDRGPLAVGGEIVDDTNLTQRTNHILRMYARDPVAAENLFKMTKQQFIDRATGATVTRALADDKSVPTNTPETTPEQANLLSAAQEVLDRMATTADTVDDLSLEDLDVLLQSGISLQPETIEKIQAARDKKAEQ